MARGYPLGLTGDKIPEFARVIAVADAFDAMTSTRSYRGARTVDEAIVELRKWAGTQFDPPMVEALITAVGKHGWVPTNYPGEQPAEALAAAPAPGTLAVDHDDPTVEAGLQVTPRQAGATVSFSAERLASARPHSHAGGVVFVALMGLVAAAATTATIQEGVRYPTAALAFGALIVIGEVLRIRLPGERDAAPIGTAAALAYALLFDISGSAAAQPVHQVVAVVACAMLVGAVARAAVGRAPSLVDLARQLLLVGVVAIVFRVAMPQRVFHLPLADYRNDLRWMSLVMVAVVMGLYFVDALVAAAVRAGRNHSPLGAMIRDELKATLGMGTAMGATGVLIALATPTMRFWALPIFCIPLVLTQFAFRRYAAIRTTYNQTIRSLSRVTEVAGYVAEGHSHRVAALAVRLGRELGLAEHQVRDLEYAALMHDIGQISLVDPINGGSTLVVAPAERRRIAGLGADIIRTTGVMDRVAMLVGRQADVYRRHREPPDDTLPLECRIIKVASAYDDLVGTNPTPTVSADALERLRLGMVFDYDPRVIEVLSRLVDRAASRSYQFSV